MTGRARLLKDYRGTTAHSRCGQAVVLHPDAKTRVRVLDTLAANRIPLIAYHFPWPGVGHIAKQGDGFRFYATPLQMVLDSKG